MRRALFLFYFILGLSFTTFSQIKGLPEPKESFLQILKGTEFESFVQEYQDGKISEIKFLDSLYTISYTLKNSNLPFEFYSKLANTIPNANLKSWVIYNLINNEISNTNKLKYSKVLINFSSDLFPERHLDHIYFNHQRGKIYQEARDAKKAIECYLAAQKRIPKSVMWNEIYNRSYIYASNIYIEGANYLESIKLLEELIDYKQFSDSKGIVNEHIEIILSKIIKSNSFVYVDDFQSLCHKLFSDEDQIIEFDQRLAYSMSISEYEEIQLKSLDLYNILIEKMRSRNYGLTDITVMHFHIANLLFNMQYDIESLKHFIEIKKNIEKLDLMHLTMYATSLISISEIYGRMGDTLREKELLYEGLLRYVETADFGKFYNYYFTNLKRYSDGYSKKNIELLEKTIKYSDQLQLYDYSVQIKLILLGYRLIVEKDSKRSMVLIEDLNSMYEEFNLDKNIDYGTLKYYEGKWHQNYGNNNHSFFCYQKAAELYASNGKKCSDNYISSIDNLIDYYSDYSKNADSLNMLIEEEHNTCVSCESSRGINQEIVRFICKIKKLSRKWNSSQVLQNHDESIQEFIEIAEKLTLKYPDQSVLINKSLIDNVKSNVTAEILLFQLHKRHARIFKNTDLFEYCESTLEMIEYLYRSGDFINGEKNWREIQDDIENMVEIERNYLFPKYAQLLIDLDVNISEGLRILEKYQSSIPKMIDYEFVTIGIPILRGLLKQGDVEIAETLLKARGEFIAQSNDPKSIKYLDFSFWVCNLYKEFGYLGKIVHWREKYYQITQSLFPEDIDRNLEAHNNLIDAYINLNASKLTEQLIIEFEQKWNIDAENYAKSNMNINSLNFYLVKKLMFVDQIFTDLKSNKVAKSDYDKLKDEGLKSLNDFMIDLDQLKDDFISNYGQDSSAYLTLIDFGQNLCDNYLSFFREEITMDEFHTSMAVQTKNLGFDYVENRNPFFQLRKRYSDFNFSIQSKDTITYYHNLIYDNLKEQLLNFNENQILLDENLSFDFKKRINELIENFNRLFVLKCDFSELGIPQSKLAFELILNNQNLISESENRINKLISHSSELSLKKAYFDSINHEYLFNQNSNEPSLITEDLIRRESIDLKYAVSSDSSMLEWIDICQVAQVLNEKEKYMMVSFFKTPSENKNYIDEYAIFSFLSNKCEVSSKAVRDVSLIFKRTKDYANRIHGNSTLREMIDTSGRYYDQFWAPIANELKGIDKVYISLDGVYNNINLATLYNKETGKYLFEEIDIEIVNSARSFIESKNKVSEQYEDLTAMLLGFPDYDHKPNVEKLEDMKEDYFASSRDITAQLTDSLSRGGRVGSLPGTKVEVETIAETLRKQKWTPTVLIESEASERAVKDMQSPRVVHMATHGYFLEDIEQDHEEDRMLGMDLNKVIENPMLRSGLLFAGANATLSGKEEQEGENGILTAYEASFLNLENTELVVMSACETAKGEQKTGEGVYGLRKAISDAGAEYVMMSLWKVDDKVTQEFMTTFYTYWMEDKMSIREAFKSTRSTIKSKYPQPYYWGAFILVGR